MQRRPARKRFSKARENRGSGTCGECGRRHMLPDVQAHKVAKALKPRRKRPEEQWSNQAREPRLPNATDNIGTIGSDERKCIINAAPQAPPSHPRQLQLLLAAGWPYSSRSGRSDPSGSALAQLPPDEVRVGDRNHHHREEHELRRTRVGRGAEGSRSQRSGDPTGANGCSRRPDGSDARRFRWKESRAS